LAHSIENLFSENWKGRTLKVLIRHISRYDLIVFPHTFDHHALDKFPDTQFKFVEWIRDCGLDDLLVFARSLFDLLKKEAIFISKVRAKAFVEYLYDFGQGRLLVLQDDGADLTWTLDLLHFSVLE
jgi:hypothetical protein